MASIEEALRTAGADGDLQTILRLLEDQSVGFNRQEAAAGAFTGLDTAVLANHLNVRMLSVIRNAQQQQQNPGTLPAPSPLHSVVSCCCF